MRDQNIVNYPTISPLHMVSDILLFRLSPYAYDGTASRLLLSTASNSRSERILCESSETCRLLILGKQGDRGIIHIVEGASLSLKRRPVGYISGKHQFESLHERNVTNAVERSFK